MNRVAHDPRLLTAASSLAAARPPAARALATARAQQAATTPSLKIKVLSNRADLLSGGDALVEIRPQGKTDMTHGAGRRRRP